VVQDRNAFLTGLSPAEFAFLCSYLTPLELRVGDYLHYAGDQIEDVVFPHSGVVAMTIPLPESTGAGVLLTGRDGIIGGSVAAAAAPAFCDAQVHIAGHASRMSASAFRYLLDQSAGIRRHAARFVSANLVQAHQTALCHAAHSVEARVCRWLLEVQERSGSSKIPLTQSTLAQFLSVRRTTVTVVAGRLEAAGVINCRRGYMQIVSGEELERHSCDCYSHVKKHLGRLFGPAAEMPTAVGAQGAAARAREPMEPAVANDSSLAR
jgi:CRP-like cAMP-binding protein